MYDLSCGARWTLVPALSNFRPGGSIEIDDEHEHERMIYILDGTFELVFPGETPTRLRTGEGAPSTAPAGIASPMSGRDKAPFSQSAYIPSRTRTASTPQPTNHRYPNPMDSNQPHQGEPAATTRPGHPVVAIGMARPIAEVGESFRGKGIARREQPREPKQSWRPRAEHAWMYEVTTGHRVCWISIPSKHRYVRVGTNRTDGRRDLDHLATARPGRSGDLIAAAISAAPFRPIQPC